MADDKHYKPGSFYRIDDISGFKVRAERTRKIWTGMITDQRRWEARNAQEFVRGVVDDQTVPDPRPRQVNQFVILGTYVTAFSPRGSNTFEVDSTVKMLPGDKLQIMLDKGENFFSTIKSIDGDLITIADALPDSVGGPVGGYYGDPLENSVLDFGGGSPAPPVDLTFILDVAGHDTLDYNVLG
jgi:hypothetical protein